MKRSLALFATISLISTISFAAGAAVPDPLAMWRTASCSAPGKVVSTKVSTRNKADLNVKVKLKTGSLTTSTVQDAKPSDFPAGSVFCAQDYSGD